MLFQIAASDSGCLKSLCSPLSYHLVIDSILAGLTPGKIFADHPTHPQAAFVFFKHHCFLVGKPDLPDFNNALQTYLNQVYIPSARTQGQEAFLFDYHPADWSSVLAQLLVGHQSTRYHRQYFTCHVLQQDWRKLLPDGFAVVRVNLDLLAQTQLRNLEAVREEMCSERPSIQDFLTQSFGFCIQREDELVAWAFSEYNTGGCCEVGIATIERFRRMGLGTVAALALVEHALANGYHTIGWDCWANNLPSAALARRAGFEHHLNYPVDLFLLPEQS